MILMSPHQFRGRKSHFATIDLIGIENTAADTHGFIAFKRAIL
jgi:hypothetical protein